MRITDLLRSEGIQLHASPSDKASAIDLLAGLQEKAGNLSDKARYKADILAREEMSSTPSGTASRSPTPRAPR